MHDFDRTTGPILAPGEVDLWVLPLLRSGEATALAWSVLSDDERSRAESLALANVRQRYVARRGALREVLSRYTGTPQADVRFRYGAFGKPRLAEGGPLHFNLTATADHVFVVLADAPVGVDAEVSTPQRGVQLRHWTATEAVTKAIGCGLGQQVDVEIDVADVEPRLLRIGHDDPAAWALVTDELEGTVVTVAVRRRSAHLRIRSRTPVEGVAS